MHNFWAAQDMSAGGMQTQFLKNVGIMGGLLMIAAHGPGKWSVERRKYQRCDISPVGDSTRLRV